MIISKNCTQKKQQGMALLMSLVMLLLVTILGVSAVRMSGLDTQIAGNSIYTSLAYQAAESAIGKSITQENLVAPATNRTTIAQISTDYVTDEAINAGAVLKSTGTAQYDGMLDGPVLNGIANSSEFKYQIIKFSAESKVNATAVKDKHTEARAVQIPSE